MFDETNAGWAAEHRELTELLDKDAYQSASRTTMNAHYTGPEITREMWSALEQLGFDGGVILEPGCGSGTFIGTAPDTAHMIGIELDPTTAEIASHIYPEATIKAESFADTRIPGGVDGAIGNVPFGNFEIPDPLHNPTHQSIHNHFIIKSLALTRPGGMVAVLTSRYTLDAQNPAARREMQAMADLVGAVRLPTGAHQRSAGTRAVTDLLIFRKRDDHTPAQPFNWELSPTTDIDGGQTKINQYFASHPEQVLGEFHLGHGIHGAETLNVTAHDLTSSTPNQLHDALQRVVDHATRHELRFAPQTTQQAAERADDISTSTQLWDGTIVDTGEEFQIAEQGKLAPLDVPKTQEAELRLLLQLRDQARALLDAEATTLEDTPGLDQQRDELRHTYQTYTAEYGPLNRFTLRLTGHQVTVQDLYTGEAMIDPETGKVVTEPGTARMTPPVMRILRRDPHAPIVWALEVFDDEEHTARPASLLSHRAVAPRPVIQGAGTPDEAVAISMDRTGTVDLPLIANLLGVNETEARDQLGTLVYDDPATHTLMTAPAYLSGDVRSRLDEAETAARQDPCYTPNVEALLAIQPDPIPIEEIQARLGSVWISADVHRQFLAEILHDRTIRVENPLPGQWKVKGINRGVLATSEWGTERAPAITIAEDAMNQKHVEIRDTIDDGDSRRQILNPVATEAAQAKLTAMQERFSEWVWEDPARAAHLADIYNRRFNSIVLRDYADAGNYLSTPGLAESITLRPHQRAAIARVIAEPAVGLFHGVGAGKTLEMVVAATELKRMGIISKPCIVVPNHMLHQFSRDWLQAYPQARVLAASSADLEKEKRRLFVARSATNDWDGIILTQGAFKKIGVGRDVEKDYVNHQLDELRHSLESAREERSLSVKEIEKAITRLETDLRKKLAMERDPGINFEDMGVDYLFVDEAHMFKNLRTVSNIRDAAITGSQQASDLHMKLEWMRSHNGGHVATLATATPLANSITEAYVMQRYLRPDLLEAAGVTSFDGWAATFGEVVTGMEMAPAGGFRLKERFAKFTNVPEMLRMWHVFADVKTPDELNLPVPEVAPRSTDGQRQPEIVKLQPTQEIVDYFAHISDRVDKITSRAVSAKDDNMLLVSTDGRKAALDLRLINEDSLPTAPVKLDAVADKIAGTWQETKDNRYLDATGQASPVRGGLQLVFCDRGTPKSDHWNAYGELKHLLVDRGMDPASIRFIHEAKNDAEKSRLFSAARAGHISVLIGSTDKMGVGTNIQTRVTAVHHVDCPWRPADLDQRDGRAIRQHNQNPEVAIYRYVVERTFDAYSWQTVARKARFIAQIMRGKLDSREIEDVGDTALSAAEAKAQASGNPLLLDQAEADSALQALKRQEIAHRRAQRALTYTRDTTTQQITHLQRNIAALKTANTRTVSTAGDAFRMTVGDHTYNTRQDAAHGLARWAVDNRWRWRAPDGDPVPIGTIGGQDLTAHVEQIIDPNRYGRTDKVVLEFDNVPLSRSMIDPTDFTEPSLGMIRAIENKVMSISKNLEKQTTDLSEAQRTLQQAMTRIGQPFPKAQELEAARAKAERIEAQLAAIAKKAQHAAPTKTETPSPHLSPTLQAAYPSARSGSKRYERAPEVNRRRATEPAHRGPER